MDENEFIGMYPQIQRGKHYTKDGREAYQWVKATLGSIRDETFRNNLAKCA